MPTVPAITRELARAPKCSCRTWRIRRMDSLSVGIRVPSIDCDGATLDPGEDDRGQISPSIPHFVIVGAPKCGTTSLYRYLQQHPRVFMPENKEPRFFCDYPVASFEFGTKQFHPSIVTAPDEYLGLFCDAPPGAILGEASTDYLSCPGVAERLHAWNPEAKIIVMLRDPIDRAYSEYQHSIAANFQTLSFAESLREEKRRFAEGYDPIFAHVRRSLYTDGVNDFQQKFGQSNVKVILFEQFATQRKRSSSPSSNFWHCRR